MARASLSSAFAVLALTVAAVQAQVGEPQDRVVLRFEDTGSRVALTCTVVDYTGRSITVQPGPGLPERIYPASQVLSVETPQTRSHIDGLSHFARGEFDLAREQLEAALKEESRTWVRREILAQLVRCALRQGDRLTAASYFILLAGSDPETHHFKLIPLQWSEQPAQESLLSEAREWSSQSGEVPRVLAASILLEDERHRETAAADLRELRVKGSAPVRHLAQAQLWRLELGTSQLDPMDLDRWEADLQKMPESLRGGPNYVLGRAALQLRQYERAAVALLWPPLVSDHDHHLAADSGLSAVEALSSAGQPGQAANLCRELLERFHDTPAAERIAVLLGRLSPAEPTATGTPETLAPQAQPPK